MRIVFSCLCLCATSVYAGSYYPRTHNPLTHVCLRTVAIINIIKGSGIQFPIPFLEIDEHIDKERLICGTTLLAISHLLHFLEHIEHPEYQKQETKKNNSILTVEVHENLQKY